MLQTNFRAYRTAEQREKRNEIGLNRLSQTRSTRTQQDSENVNEDDTRIVMTHRRPVETNSVIKEI